MSPQERVLRARIASHASWSKTEDRAARTAKARAALDQKFLDEAGGDPVRAEHLRQAYYARLSLKSLTKRRHAREALEAEAAQAEAELAAAQATQAPAGGAGNGRR
jgi:hypothetical protein